MRKHLCFVIVLLLLVFALAGCGSKKVSDEDSSLPVPTATPAPVCQYPVLSVRDDFFAGDQDSLIGLAKEKSYPVFAEGRCRLAAGCFEALNDVRFTFAELDESDIAVTLPDEIPDGFRELCSIELAIWSPESEEQTAIYEALEEELSVYLD